MKKQFEIVHSEDATTIVVKGDRRNPEPSTAVIRFPGGHVEVSRCSDGTYWAHVATHEDDDPTERPQFEVVGTRVDYDDEFARMHGIRDIPDADHVTHLAMRFRRARDAGTKAEAARQDPGSLVLEG